MLKKLLLLCSFLFFFFTTVKAQGPDCDVALTICSDGPVDFNPQGPGFNDFTGNNSGGCLVANEHQSAWYYFEMNPSTPPGIDLGFTINPNAGSLEDYDFAIYGPNLECDNLGSPIRCSFADDGCIFCPETGLGMGASDVSEGAGGDGFVLPLFVNAGEGYFLVVDNFNNSSQGFSMTWTGGGAPFLNCDATPGCELMADPIPPQTFCQGSLPTTLFASVTGAIGPVTYSWVGDGAGTSYLDDPFSPNPNVTIPPDFFGTITYTLTVTEGSCMDTEMVTITVNPSPMPTILPVGPLCTSDNPELLSATPPGGIWGGSTFTGVIDPVLLGPGTHMVTYEVTDANTCSNVVSIDIIINDAPLVSIDGNTFFCLQDGFTPLNANASGGTGGPYTYQWDTPQGPNGGATINASLPGLYSVTVTDGSGCLDEDMTFIQVSQGPIITFGPVPPICVFDGLIVIDAFPLGGTWDESTGIIDGLGVVNTVAVGPGIHTISYSATDLNGCTATNSMDIEIIDIPDANASAGGPYCEGELIDLFGSTTSSGGLITYFWTGPNGYFSTDQNPTGLVDPGT